MIKRNNKERKTGQLIKCLDRVGKGFLNNNSNNSLYNNNNKIRPLLM